MYEAFREAPQSKKDRSRLKLGLWITLAAVLLALTATPLVWASRQSAAYHRYMDALNGSVLSEGEGVALDFGDGSLLRLWEVPIRGGYTPEETFGVFVAYTYPDGETYCYDTGNLGWDRVVDSLPSAG